MNIILLAPPAAGKGTQAELLTEEYNLNHISTGDLLREASQEQTEFGNKLKSMLESGNLVSDELVLEVLDKYLAKTNNFNLLLDGFPRDIYQAEKLDELLKSKGSKIDYVFLLNVDKDTLLYRITGRRLCKSCGAIYNVNIDPLKPKIDSICDKCGGNLIARKDDNEETFKVRYQEYEHQTKPLIDYYLRQNNLYEIDSSISKEDTFRQIKSIFEQSK
ncbi:MAG: adenylate kinase [Tenericutes bacterium]|nr:adenylate kinase [Mycoplasmatota bacterium]